MRDLLPYEQCSLFAFVSTSNRDGIVSDGWGDVRIRAMEGRSFAIEITEDLSGLTITAVLDWGRPKRARVHLQADALRSAVEAASRQDGIPAPMPEPH